MKSLILWRTNSILKNHYCNPSKQYFMNAKNLIISSVVGSLVYFMLGYLFYGVLFTNIYPPSDNENLLLVYLGCLTFCILLAYIFLQWAGIKDPMSGGKAGAIVGTLYGAGMNFFMYSSQVPNYTNMITDIVINGIMGAIAGAVIAFVIGRLT